MLEFIKAVHILAAFVTVASLSGVIIHVRNGGSKSDNGSRSLMGASHGVGLLVSLISGFAMLGMMGFGAPPWALAKLGIWLVLGGLTALLYKKPSSATALWILALLLPSLAAYLAIAKPF